MASDTIEAIAPELERRMVAFMRERLATMGSHDSGLYNYYLQLSNKGRAYSSYDVPIADFLVAKAPRFERYIDVGAGLGQLSALLLKAGLNAVPIELDLLRHRALQAMFTLLDLPDQAILGRFPDSAGEVLGPNSLVICSGVVGGDPNLEDDLIAGVVECGAAVIDLAHFGRGRPLPEQEHLDQKLEALGIMCRERFWLRGGAHLAYYERVSPS